MWDAILTAVITGGFVAMFIATIFRFRTPGPGTHSDMVPPTTSEMFEAAYAQTKISECQERARANQWAGFRIGHCGTVSI